MKKMLMAFVAALAVAFATLAVPATADAKSKGGAVAAGVIGGLAAGAIIGSMTGGPVYAAPPPPPVYYAPAPVYDEPECRIVRQRFWDGYGYRTRRVEVCD